MDKKELLLIYNPKAGRTLINEHLSHIIDLYTNEGYLVTAYPTQDEKDATSFLVENKHVYDRIVCSGGDGTLNDVVNGILKKGLDVPLGYIPSGSTNDFAQTLGIPSDMIEAASISIGDQLFKCDTGTFNDSIFVYIAAFGLFTDVSYDTNQQMKNALGHVAYLLKGVSSLSAIQFYKMKFHTHEQDYEDEYIYGMISNSISVGGVKNITGKDIELDDGEFEVTLIKRPKSFIELNLIVPALLTGNYDECDAIEHFKTSHIEVESEELVKWTLDGEFGGEHQKVTIDNNPRSINIAYNTIVKE